MPTLINIDTSDHSIFSSKDGLFAFAAKSNPYKQYHEWLICREAAMNYWNWEFFFKPPTKYLLFCYRGVNKEFDITLFSKLWEELETLVKVDDKTIISQDVAQDILHFSLSSFWMQNETRRSFCTLFVRGLVSYQKDTILNSMGAYPLALTIIEAIQRFLSGYTNPTYKDWTPCVKYPGVVSEFYGLRPDAIAAKLI